MDRLIITMPIAPYNDFSIGKMTTPVLAKCLATKLNAKYILAINCLDSYKKREIKDYVKLLEKYNIAPDEYWIDVENISKLLDKLLYLIENKYVTFESRKIMFCNCKKVEISINNIYTINKQDSCFYEQNNKYYCRYCGGECKIGDEDSLVFNPKKIVDKKLNFFPEFINKDIKTFYNTVMNNEIIISRKRDTGVSIIYNGKKINIDIDFLWEMYLSMFTNKEKIVLCSNHQLYQLFLVSMLEKCFDNGGKTISLATPYLDIRSKEDGIFLKDRIVSMQIFTILNQKWSKKENVFDNGLLTYINSMSVSKKEKLYNLLMEQNFTDNLLNDLKKTLIKDFNLQNANRELKRRRNNV